MDDSVRAALFGSQVIDLTTTGRRTGRRRRIEIFLHEKDGVLLSAGCHARTGPGTGSITSLLTHMSSCT